MTSQFGDDESLMPFAELGFMCGGFFFFIYWFSLMVTGDFNFVTRDNIFAEIVELKTEIEDLKVVTGFLSIYLPWGFFLFCIGSYGLNRIRWSLGVVSVVVLFMTSIFFLQNMKDLAFIRRRLNEVEEFENPDDALVNEYQTLFLAVHLNCCFEDDERPDLTCEALANDEPFVEPCIGNNETFDFFDGLVENGEDLCNRKVKIRRVSNRNNNGFGGNRALEKNVLNDPAFCITGRRNYVRFLGRYTANLTFHLMPIAAIGGVGGLLASIGLFVLYIVQFPDLFFKTVSDEKSEDNKLVFNMGRGYDDDIPVGETVEEKL